MSRNWRPGGACHSGVLTLRRGVAEVNHRILSGIMTGLFAAAVFFVAVLVLVGLAFAYGSIYAIAPEFPVVMTQPFFLSLLAAVVFLPLAGAVIGSRGRDSTFWRAVLAGGGLSALVAIAICFLTAGGQALVDWPGLLYLLQLALAAFIAGAVLAAGFEINSSAEVASANSGSVDLPGGGVAGNGSGWPGRWGRLTLAWIVVSLLLLMLPFLLLWTEKRSFATEAGEEAAELFVLPAEAEFIVSEEGGRVESLGANQRYAATFSQREGGQEFTVTVKGDRRRFTVTLDEVSAWVNIFDEDTARAVDWQTLTTGSDSAAELVALVQPFVRNRLALTKVRTDLPVPEVWMKGEGVEVVARPAGSPQAPVGMYISFRAPPP